MDTNPEAMSSFDNLKATLKNDRPAAAIAELIGGCDAARWRPRRRA